MQRRSVSSVSLAGQWSRAGRGSTVAGQWSGQWLLFAVRGSRVAVTSLGRHTIVARNVCYADIQRVSGRWPRKPYKQGVRAPLLWPRVAGRRAFVPAGCGGYTLLFDIVPHPALLVAGAVSGRRCRLGGGGLPAHIPHAFCLCQQDISDRTRFAFVAELFAAAPV